MSKDDPKSKMVQDSALGAVARTVGKKLFAQCAYCPELRIYWVKRVGDENDLFFRSDQALDLGTKLAAQGREAEFVNLIKIAVRARLRPHKIVNIYASDLTMEAGELVRAEVEFSDPAFGEDPFDMDDESQDSPAGS
jgi:hypothetical protein